MNTRRRQVGTSLGRRPLPARREYDFRAQSASTERQAADQAESASILVCPPGTGLARTLVRRPRLPDSKKRSRIEAFLRRSVDQVFPVLPYDQACAEHHASERARLVAMGLTPPFLDGQIAAIAYVHDLVLVTSNVSDFQNFEGVDVVDWRA